MTIEHTARALDDRLRKLCHDVQQPAAAIIALADVVRREPGLSDSTRERLQHIAEQARHVQAMCSGGSDGASAREPVMIDLLVAAVAAGAGLRYDVTVHVDCPAVQVEADRVALRRILDNLVANACRAAEPRGEVRVAIRVERGGLVLEVLDNGPGPGAGPPGHAGLGLSIVQDMLDLTDGTLDLERRTDEPGTRARVVIAAPDAS